MLVVGCDQSTASFDLLKLYHTLFVAKFKRIVANLLIRSVILAHRTFVIIYNCILEQYFLACHLALRTVGSITMYG